MFLKTLDISERVVPYPLQKKEQKDASAFTIEDQHGRHMLHNSTAEEKLDEVRAHINSFPQQCIYVTFCTKMRKTLFLENWLPKGE